MPGGRSRRSAADPQGLILRGRPTGGPTPVRAGRWKPAVSMANRSEEVPLAPEQIDPDLLRQLDDAATSGNPVTAVVTLRRTAGSAPDPTVVEELARSAVDRTVRTTGEKPGDVHVMGRLSVAYVSGSEKFVRAFVGQPEVVSAVANRPSTARGAGATAGATADAANGRGSAEDAPGTPVSAPREATGRSNGGTAALPH